MVNLRPCLVLIAILLTTGVFGCKSKQSGNQTNNQSGNENAETAAKPGGVSGGKGSGGRIFRGQIEGSRVQMTLVREGDQLSGGYYYQKVGKELSLKGSINGQGDFTLQEFDSGGSQTGEFKGKWSEPSTLPTASLEGTWAKPNSKETLFFYATEQVVAFSNGLSVVPKEIKEENKKQKYSIKVEYPELSGATNTNVDKFNQEVKKLVTKEISAFKQGEEESGSDEPNVESETGSDLQIWFNVVLATNDLVSVLFDVSNYSQGAAHPNGYSLVLNFDLKSGKTLNLSDLFSPKSDYLNAISRVAISDLKKQSGQDADSEWIERGAGPESENYNSWNISKKGLAITFDPYQVASYAEGPKHVVIPYSVLKDVTRADGPINFIGN